MRVVYLMVPRIADGKVHLLYGAVQSNRKKIAFLLKRRLYAVRLQGYSFYLKAIIQGKTELLSGFFGSCPDAAFPMTSAAHSASQKICT